MTLSRDVRVGSRILATDENRELVVEQVIDREWARYHGYSGTDISAMYVDRRAGVDRDGNDVFGNRGFRFDHDNWVVLIY